MKKPKRHIFFSVVIPAHNEEKYIGKTLKRLTELEYPKDFYEVIVVENGSSDKTFEVANQFANARTRVFSLKERGVSHARNYGISKVHPSAEWVFFLDADIFVDPPFLAVANSFILEREDKGYVAGTCSLKPFPAAPVMNFLHFWMNLGFFMFGGAYGGALMVKHGQLDSIRFDEDLEVGEDLKLSEKMRQKGKFFFMYTSYLHASTRRFQDGGLRRVPVWVGIWMFSKIIPRSFQRRLAYKVMR